MSANSSAHRELVMPAPAIGPPAEATLRGQRELLRVTLGGIGDAVLSTDAEGHVTFLNPVAESLTGWACYLAKGLPLETVFRVVDAESRRPAENPAAPGLRPGAIGGRANRALLIARDGTERIIEGIAAPTRDEQGKAAGGVLVFRDVSDRRLDRPGAGARTGAEHVGETVPQPLVVLDAGEARALEASEVRYRRLFETAQDAILILDADTGAIFDANPFLVALLGYPREELVGRELWEIGLFRDREANRAAMRQLQQQGYIRYEDLPLETRDGTRKDVEFVSNVYEVAQQRVIQCNIRDITDRKRAEAALKEADRRKDEFLAMLAHELRNPLAPIRSAVDMMRRKGSDDPDVRWARDVIDRQVQQLTHLMDDLLDVSRISKGKITLRKERLDLAAVVGRAVEISRPLIDARKHRLEVALPDPAVYVDGDPTRLAQVVSNLLNNAAKYTEEGGRIGLTVERAGDRALLRVRDTGIGIAADALPIVFELFSQVPSAVSRSEGGLGIGLALVRSLVELHGGSVEATSRGPGLGSEFLVRLPRSPEPPPRAPAAADPGGRTDRGPPRLILVVDDNGDAAEMLAVLLRLQGHEVRTAYDGPAALDAVRAQAPDAVLCDLGMPGMDGFEVARCLRQDFGLRQVLLVALTGYGQEEDRRRSREAGFDAHLVKPVDIHAVFELLARHGSPAAP